MTDRQYVLKFYPDAVLDFQVKPRNTLRSRAFYQILTQRLNFGSIIAKGETRSEAWKNAKRKVITNNQQP